MAESCDNLEDLLLDEDPSTSGSGDPKTTGTLADQANVILKLIENNDFREKLTSLLGFSTPENLQSNNNNSTINVDPTSIVVDSEDYLGDISNDVTHQEKRGPPLNDKICKILQDMANSVHKEDKFQALMKETCPPENLEGLETNKVNVEVWRTISHKLKSADMKLQNIQSIIHKAFTTVSYVISDLYSKRADKENFGDTIKQAIRKSVDASLLLGKANSNILNYRRENIMPELNPTYKQLSFKTGEHPKLLFGDDLPKAIKDISETNKVGYNLTPRNFHQNKRGGSFLLKSRGHHYQQRGKPRHRYQPYQQHHQPRFNGSLSKSTITHHKQEGN